MEDYIFMVCAKFWSCCHFSKRERKKMKMHKNSKLQQNSFLLFDLRVAILAAVKILHNAPLLMIYHKIGLRAATFNSTNNPRRSYRSPSTNLVDCLLYKIMCRCSHVMKKVVMVIFSFYLTTSVFL